MLKRVIRIFAKHSLATAWLLVAAVSVLIRMWTPASWIEAYYSRWLYPLLRTIVTDLSRLTPFALLYMVVPIVLGLLLYAGWRSWRSESYWLARLRAMAFFSLGSFSFLIVAFLWSWGFNYGRVSVADHLAIEEIDFSLDSLEKALHRETDALIHLRSQLPFDLGDSIPLSAASMPGGTEELLIAGLERVLTRFDYPIRGGVRVKKLYPPGVLLRLSTMGIFFPFSGEGHYDAGLSHLLQPEVMAHELAHGYGFGDEGECNFWAYLACMESNHPWVQYAGRLVYWRTLALQYKQARPNAYQTFRASLPPGVLADNDAINVNLLAFRRIMPELRHDAYDAYLRLQGIGEGIDNYDKVVLLVESWRHKMAR